MSRPKLQSVGVPWRIDDATPFMKLSPVEGGGHELVQVTFVGQFGPPQIATKLPTEDRPQVVEDPGDFLLSKAPSSAPYRMIRVSFFGVVDSWAFSTISHLPLENDFEFPNYGGQNFWKSWQFIGLCPDPHMYEVHPALGLRESEIGAGEFIDVVRIERIKGLQLRYSEMPTLKHYLLLGHDVNIEVIAEKWTWEEGQALPRWR